jgi:arylsulfatase A-like enzyme
VGKLLDALRKHGLYDETMIVVMAPDSGEAHSFLADAYQQLGRVGDAERERAAARKLAVPTSR